MQGKYHRRKLGMSNERGGRERGRGKERGKERGRERGRGREDVGTRIWCGEGDRGVGEIEKARGLAMYPLH